MTIRSLELRWADSFLNVLHNLVFSKTKKSVTNPRILDILVKIAIAEQSYDYCLGNESITTQVKMCLEREETRRRAEDLEDVDQMPASQYQQILEKSQPPRAEADKSVLEDEVCLNCSLTIN